MTQILQPITLARQTSTPPVVLITLQRTPERTKRALERLTKIGIEPTVLWGADGSDWAQARAFPRDPRCLDIGHNMQAGEVGCCMSWWMACAMIVRNDWATAIVLEDDAELLAPWQHVLDAVYELPGNFDIALLHNQHAPRPMVAHGGHTKFFRRVVTGSWTTSALCVSNGGARKLLRQLPPFDRPVDVYIGGQSPPFDNRHELRGDHPHGLCLYQPLEGRGWFRQDNWQKSTVRINPSVGAIPKTIHRIWVGDAPIPEEYQGYWREWGRLHPEFKRRTWDDEAIEAEWPKHPALLAARNAAEKSDMARLFILQKHGGLYVDTDFEPLRPIDRFLEAASALVPDMRPGEPCNGFLAFAPHHKLINEMVKAAVTNMLTTKGSILDRAGPRMVEKVLLPWRNNWEKEIHDGDRVCAKALADTGLVIIEPWVLFPYYWTDERPAGYGDAWAVHHWARSWWGDKEWADFNHHQEMTRKAASAPPPVPTIRPLPTKLNGSAIIAGSGSLITIN